MPFRKPDASDGDASTYEGALAAAERRAGRSLSVIDPLWARAWIRLLRGEEIWPSRASREPRARPPRSTTSAAEAQSIWSVLGASVTSLAGGDPDFRPIGVSLFSFRIRG